jgi:hypothetical protein
MFYHQLSNKTCPSHITTVSLELIQYRQENFVRACNQGVGLIREQ